jgi:hypothetical protein
MIPARLIRTFTSSALTGGEVAQTLARVLDLVIPPARGQWLTLPGDPGPYRIERVVQHARVPTGFTPGWKLTELLDVMLEAEPASGLDAAVKAGWKAL